MADPIGVVKPMYFDKAAGYQKEIPTTGEVELGKLTLGTELSVSAGATLATSTGIYTDKLTTGSSARSVNGSIGVKDSAGNVRFSVDGSNGSATAASVTVGDSMSGGLLSVVATDGVARVAMASDGTLSLTDAIGVARTLLTPDQMYGRNAYFGFDVASKYGVHADCKVKSYLSINLATTIGQIDQYGGSPYDLIDGDRVLVASQLDPIENGIYAWSASTQMLTRAADLVDGDSAYGAIVRVQGGYNANDIFQCQSAASIVGTDPLTPWTLVATGTVQSIGDGSVSLISGTGAQTAYIEGATGHAMFGAISIADQATPTEILGLTATPSDATSATSKAYVDAVAQGLAIKDPCHVASVSNLASLATTTEVDGHTLQENERVLVRAQDTATENGIYRFNGTGLVRAADMATGSHAAGAFTFVQFGTYADCGFVCTADAPNDVVGTNALPFVQFSAAGTIQAGNGLTKDGNTISVKLDGAGASSGLAISVDGTKVVADSAKALAIDSTLGLQVKADGAKALAIDSTAGLQVVADSAKALAINSSLGLQVVADSAKALAIDSSLGLQVVADSAKALAIDSSLGLQVVADGNYALKIDSTAGLRVKVDGTTITINSSGELQGAQSSSSESNFTAGESLTAGDPVYVGADGKVYKSAAGTASTAWSFGVAESSVSADAAVSVVRNGKATGVLSGATAGTRYYLATGGGLVAGSGGLSSGDRVILAGIAESASDLQVMVRDYGTLA